MMNMAVLDATVITKEIASNGDKTNTPFQSGVSPPFEPSVYSYDIVYHGLNQCLLDL